MFRRIVYSVANTWSIRRRAVARRDQSRRVRPARVPLWTVPSRGFGLCAATSRRSRRPWRRAGRLAAVVAAVVAAVRLSNFSFARRKVSVSTSARVANLDHVRLA